MNNDNEDNFDEQPDLPMGEDGKNPFGMPRDYFSLFEDRLKKKMEDENELKGYPVLHSITKTNVFDIPENYFSVFENILAAKVELADFESLQGISKPVYIQPEEGYFENAATQLQYKIELVDELRTFEMLHQLEKTTTFEVPVNYFENLPFCIKDKIHTDKEKRISIVAQLLDFVFGKRMVVSFGLLALIGFGIYLYQRENEVTDINDCKTLACLEKQEIIEQNGLSRLDEDQLMELVDVKLLDKQLKTIITVDTLRNEEYILEELNTDQLIEEL